MVTADLAAPDPSVLESAVHGADAVLSGLGPRSAADAGITAPGTEAVIRAMQATGVRRVVVVSAAPVGTVPSPGRPKPPRHDPGDGFFMRHLFSRVVRAAFRRHYADLARAGAAVAAPARHGRVPGRRPGHPHRLGGGGLLFGLGYLLVTLVHTGMFLLSSHESAVRAVRRLGPANAITAALLLLAGFTQGPLQWFLWTAAFGLHWVSPFFTAVPGFPIRAAHFVERHGLIVLIALGESIVAIGIGTAGHGLQADRVVTAVLGLTVAAALWWLYFDGEDERAERTLDAAPVDRASWLALYGFGYAFLPLLGGIILFAAGVKNAVVAGMVNLASSRAPPLGSARSTIGSSSDSAL